MSPKYPLSEAQKIVYGEQLKVFLEKRSKLFSDEDLEKLIFEVDKASTLVWAVLNEEVDVRYFWTSLENFRIGLLIATLELRHNSLKLLAKNEKYACLVSAFLNYRKHWFGEKIPWKVALQKLGIKYIPRR